MPHIITGVNSAKQPLTMRDMNRNQLLSLRVNNKLLHENVDIAPILAFLLKDNVIREVHVSFLLLCNFMQFLRKFGKIVCCRPPLPHPRGLAPPPEGNPGSATANISLSTQI